MLLKYSAKVTRFVFTSSYSLGMRMSMKIHPMKVVHKGKRSSPLTTDDTFWRRQILAACYQLAQSVLNIGSVLAERVGQGEVSGSTALPDSAWWRLQLPVGFWQFRQFLVQRSILWSEGPDY